MAEEVLFFLTHRGFYAEVIGLINAKIHCEKEGARLLVNTDRFVYGDIRAYLDCEGFDFSPPRTAEPKVSLPWSTPVPEHTSNYERMLHSPKTWEEVRPVAVKMFSKVPPSDMVLPEVFDAVHIRRGDKTFDWHTKQSAFFEVKDFLNRLDPKDETVPLYVMTDDYTIIEEVRRHTKRPLLYKVQTDERGWFSYHFMGTAFEKESHDDRYGRFAKENIAERDRSTRKLLEETWICTRARTFVGTFSSNVGKFIKTVHPHPQNCVSLDDEWNWY